jgi:hypothetical protein
LTLAPGAVLPGELEITYRCSIRDDGVWDLWAKFQGKTAWKLLVDMSPPELVRCLDFRYVTDALTPDEATSLLDANAPTRAERERPHFFEQFRNLFGCIFLLLRKTLGRAYPHENVFEQGQ